MSAVKIKRGDFGFVIVVTFIVGFIAGVYLAPQNLQQPYKQPDLSGEVVVTMGLPAVDSEGNGVMGILYTTVKPGTGKILVDTSRVLNYLDTQLSGRIAATSASNYAKVNLSNLDIIYTIKVNASIIEGPSAGASMALSVLLALDNRTSDNIMITGTINLDGTIGRVGSVFEKARSAKESGADVFLVPSGQSTADKTTRSTVCNKVGPIEMCRINYNTERVNIGEHLGLGVYEVRDLAEAYEYFINRTR